MKICQSRTPFEQGIKFLINTAKLNWNKFFVVHSWDFEVRCPVRRGQPSELNVYNPLSEIGNTNFNDFKKVLASLDFMYIW